MIEMMDGENREKNTSPGELSFSSYLTTAEEIFVHKFAEPQVSFRRLQRNKTQVGDEICVFGAETYFNRKLDDHEDAKFSTKQQDDLVHQMAPRRWPATPSASSQARWNSQSVLLRSLRKDRSVNKQKRVDGMRCFFSRLSCSESCSDGKSVYINRKVVHAKDVIRNNSIEVKDEFDRMSVGSNRELCFKSQLDNQRKSMEVLGSTAMNKGDITKKLSMITWDAIPNTPTTSSVSRSTRVDDDVESDCSSDLFEIDNIYADVPTALSSCMTTYAPSETNIEWSVVTARAVDSSFVSDYDEKKSKAAGRVANVVKEAQRSRSGGIFGCKTHKAVMVAETAYTRDGKMKSPSIIDP